MKSKKSRLMQGAFALYSMVTFWLLFSRPTNDLFGTYWETLRYNLNVIPLFTIRNYLYILNRRNNPYLIRHAYVNLLGNVLLFVPLGFFLPALFPRQRSFKRFFLWLCLIILLIEVVQLFTLRGSCDIDDFILNCIGGCIGYGIRNIFSMKKDKSEA